MISFFKLGTMLTRVHGAADSLVGPRLSLVKSNIKQAKLRGCSVAACLARCALGRKKKCGAIRSPVIGQSGCASMSCISQVTIFYLMMSCES